MIRRARANGSAVELLEVGTGRIVYADCNEAEFRAVVGDSVRVMSARRAKPVQRCTELDCANSSKRRNAAPAKTPSGAADCAAVEKNRMERVRVATACRTCAISLRLNAAETRRPKRASKVVHSMADPCVKPRFS